MLQNNNNKIQEKANNFDKAGLIKHETEKTLTALKELNQKYPFTTNPHTIEKLTQSTIEEFIQTVENIYKQLKYTTTTNKTQLQINEFKLLLHTTIDNKKTLTQKIDTHWKNNNTQQDKNLHTQIIYSLNYENKNILPIFNTQHLQHFTKHTNNTTTTTTNNPTPGQEYEQLTTQLLKTKNNTPTTRGWNNLYYTHFLYQTYPPPNNNTTTTTQPQQQPTITTITNEQIDMQGFVQLLGELQKQHKITGEEFRENRKTWTQLKPNDRELLTIRLKQRLNNNTTQKPKTKNQTITKKRKL
ncbi:MAG: hypothetical protein LBE76_04595 [Nitrososphaerota archaeon]|jgi:hypothetical protein|nr:hypothetical protein [Nitrososphaerota archaeon]